MNLTNDETLLIIVSVIILYVVFNYKSNIKIIELNKKEKFSEELIRSMQLSCSSRKVELDKMSQYYMYPEFSKRQQEFKDSINKRSPRMSRNTSNTDLYAVANDKLIKLKVPDSQKEVDDYINGFNLEVPVFEV
jgi:hypothetical protein